MDAMIVGQPNVYLVSCANGQRIAAEIEDLKLEVVGECLITLKNPWIYMEQIDVDPATKQPKGVNIGMRPFAMTFMPGEMQIPRSAAHFILIDRRPCNQQFLDMYKQFREQGNQVRSTLKIGDGRVPNTQKLKQG